MPAVDPASVSSRDELDRLNFEEKVQLARLHPEVYAAASGRTAPAGLAPLSPEEATVREAGLVKLAAAEKKRVANVRTYDDFTALPMVLQMRLATETPEKYAQLRAGLRDRLSRPHLSAGTFTPTPPPVPVRRGRK